MFTLPWLEALTVVFVAFTALGFLDLLWWLRR